MQDVTQAQLARGMRDLLPDEMDAVRAIEEAFAATCRSWGYREIRTPVVEPLHLFTAAGTLSPQSLDRVYSFLDWDGWSGERVVLRPDSTIPAARMYAQALSGEHLAKLFYRQNVFRFTDDGSPREEWQCGVELIGDTGLAGDVELVLLAEAVLASRRESGAAKSVSPTVRLSHAGLVRAVLAAAGMGADEQSAAYDRLLDGDLRVVEEVEARLPALNAPLHLLFDVEGAGSGYLANVRGALSGAIQGLTQPLDELTFVVAALEARGIAPLVHAVLARSFEYYSGIVTSFDVAGRRVGGGGRYDDLIDVIGGRTMPASGFALHVAPLLAWFVESTAHLNTGGLEIDSETDTPALIAMKYEAAERLRAAGLPAGTIGAVTASCRLICRAAEPHYVLALPEGDQSFGTLDDVLRALERHA